eukprot:GFUD01074697.1.p1 GENE.GFUD01074697.1~~GFUD01074697.1.p1  ORF type:complete len:135 (-),score=13.74 GFUD01074697.1:106-510(-)
MNHQLQCLLFSFAVFLTVPVKTLRCYDSTNLTTVECLPGIHHCLKLVETRNETVTQSCAYFSMTPAELNSALLNSLEGTCFKGSPAFAFTETPLKIMKGFMQCPCEQDLCNGGTDMCGGFLLMIVSVFTLFFSS